GDSQVALDWVPALDGQLITSYTVHNSFASNGQLVPDFFVNAIPGTTVVPTNAIVTGLTDGVSYQFIVAASNSIGTSPYSLPSNVVTPQAQTVPSAPTGVVALAGNASASVGWVTPVSNGGSNIKSYTVTALVSGASTGIGAIVPAPASSLVVSGLTNGTAYTFVWKATNATGDSAPSAPSNPVTPQPPPSPNVANLFITLSGPSVMFANSSAGYQITVTNKGTATISQVIVADTFAASGASLFAATPS